MKNPGLKNTGLSILKTKQWQFIR